MFTLKLYQNGPLPPEGRSVIMETVGVWVDHCDDNILHIRAFRKTVGVEDENGTPEFYVGGDLASRGPGEVHKAPPDCIVTGRGGNYYTWGVLENAQGKTTEMFR